MPILNSTSQKNRGCTLNQFIANVLPLLDGFSGQLVAAYCFYRHLGSIKSIKATANKDIAKVHKAVSEARNIEAFAKKTAKSYANKAKSVVKNIAARVESVVTHPLGSLYLDSVISKLSDFPELLDKMMGFVEGLPREIDTFAGRAKTFLAKQSILNFLTGDNAAMGYAQMLTEQLNKAIDNAMPTYDNIEDELTSLYVLAVEMYDGQWWNNLRDNVRSAIVDLRLSNFNSKRVYELLNDSNIFDGRYMDLALNFADSARDKVLPIHLKDVQSASGIKRSLKKLSFDALNSTFSQIALNISLNRAALDNSVIVDLVGALITLELEFTAAFKKASKQLSIIEVFMQQIQSVQDDMQSALDSDNGIRLVKGEIEWATKLTLATGKMDIFYNPVTRALLASRGKYQIENILYRDMVDQLLAIEVPNLPVDKLLKTSNNATKLFSGSFSSSGGNDQITQFISGILTSLRTVRHQRSILLNIKDCTSTLVGFPNTDLDSVISILSSFKFGGWSALLSNGRLAELLDFNPSILTGAGLAIRCLSSIVSNAPPDQATQSQELIDKLKTSDRIEKMLIARDDALQDKYQKAVDKEHKRLEAMKGNIDTLKKAFNKVSSLDPNSFINTLERKLVELLQAPDITPEQKETMRKAERKKYYQRNRGLGPEVIQL